jgi:hypothetical protein
VDFGGLAIFENAKDTYVCVPLLAKQKQPVKIEVARITTLDFKDLDSKASSLCYAIPPERLAAEAWSLKSDAETGVFEKITKAGTPLGKYVEGRMFYGVKTGLNEAFELARGQYQEILARSPASNKLIKRFLGGQDIRRYHTENVDQYLIVIPNGWTREEMSKARNRERVTSEKEAWLWLSREYLAIAKHLEPFAEACRKRQDHGEFWWELRPCDYYQYFDAPKIIFPDICKAPRFHFDTLGLYLTNTAYCLGTGSKYLLAILNSRLFWFAISNISIPFGIRAGEYRYRLIYQYMEKVPIRPINFSDPADKARHGKMVTLVDRMLDLNKKKHSGKLAPSELERLEREIASTDRQIDGLVYQLYEITRQEQDIIEAGGR